ncbi:MAG: hypothetical protein KatS3mg059_0532 [Thermomicrobiales bacterium]|nr:MAG: hypothetical protein KatS3mg059_0532 [Thermomicrobiales bacterium]
MNDARLLAPRERGWLEIEVDCFEQGGKFAGRQIAPRAHRQTGNAQRTEPNPAQALYRNARRVHETPHEVVFPFMNDDLDEHAFGSFPQQPNLARNDEAAVDDDPLSQFF